MRSGFFLLCAFVLFVASLPVAAAPTHGAAASSSTIVIVGKSEFIDLDFEASTIVVGAVEKADVVLVTPRRIYILGKSLGTTNVQILDEDGVIRLLLDLAVSADVNEAQSAINKSLPGNKIHIHSVNGRIRLAGSVPDTLTEKRALDIAQSFSVDPVINTLQVSDPKQVFLQVRIIEAVRSFGQELGIDLPSVSSTLSAAKQLNSPLTGTLTLDINATVDAMVSRGLARYLATPTLTALSGETASFLAGGEVPIPVSSGDNPTIVYKEFGVRLNFTPEVRANGLINLRLEPEVSQIDNTNSYSANGFEVPAFSTRRASTTVELRSGESFVKAGLIQSTEFRNTKAFPWLSQTPLLGPLFRKSSLKDSETELLIIVTPSLTRPVSNATKIITPMGDTRPSAGAELFVDGKIERSTYSLQDAINGKGISGNFGPTLSIGGKGAFHTN